MLRYLHQILEFSKLESLDHTPLKVSNDMGFAQRADNALQVLSQAGLGTTGLYSKREANLDRDEMESNLSVP